MRKALGGLFLAITISGCASLGGNNKKQNEAWYNLNLTVPQGEWVLVTVENKDRDLVPICGQFGLASQTFLDISLNEVPNNFWKVERSTIKWIFKSQNGWMLHLDRKQIYSVEYCLKRNPDRKPLYQNYDP